MAMHPRQVLLGAQSAAGLLPVCDHYCGLEARMLKSLQLQAEMAAEFGSCVFDVTLDCEDGAPSGGEQAHAGMIAEMIQSTMSAWRADRARGDFRPLPRIAVRVHAVDHPSFLQDVALILGAAGGDVCHVMIPKVESVSDVDLAVTAVDAALSRAGVGKRMPLHVLIESPAAVHRAFDVAAHTRVQSVSFGLMDFVSAHAGGIPAAAMKVIPQQPDSDEFDQFSHPLVVRAKLEISEACHAWGKVPSHCVVTEFSNEALTAQAARRAIREFGYQRMWSIHPGQIRPILEAFSPSIIEVEQASQIIDAAVQAQWAPISLAGQLHDRASYRYFWQVLERAQQTGRVLPEAARAWFATEVGVSAAGEFV